MPINSIESIPIPRTSSEHDVVWDRGRVLLQELKRKGIGTSTNLKHMRSLTAHSIGIKISPQHTVAFIDMRYFTSMGHGFVEAVVRRYLSHHEERPLWVSISSRGDGANIVKGKASNRISAALKQALLNAGYDSYGRRMSEADWRRHCKVLGIRETRLDPQRQLHGSMDISAMDAKLIHKVPFVGLRKHFEKVVQTLEREIGRGGNGVPVGKSTGRPNERPRPQDKSQPGRPQEGGSYRRPYNNSGNNSWQNRPPSRYSQPSQGNRGKASF